MIADAQHAPPSIVLSFARTQRGKSTCSQPVQCHHFDSVPTFVRSGPGPLLDDLVTSTSDNRIFEPPETYRARTSLSPNLMSRRSGPQ
ncbi:hypothetical protein HYQ44_013190 [Verticillium longisporum]|nr:hypothetical protein HYQ44_013190 [Verticillium longisporum]